ncbi:NAD(P)/FAD-dependent oxidoreductase [Motilibacter deserti]|uniref:NAD(P)/FAD-dependent oxidoreductase n=1 Tax=Motilibacter deserti TaxID=2714956 RepID=A0ABX0H1N5_9ACTN|nr:NAD(P)/FAD-dependent oxidoreductase [Motilibacter deserti]
MGQRSGADAYDVVVVGGSFAGLQAALTLGRACRRVLVLDDGAPRNATAVAVNNFLGQRRPRPADLLGTAREALAEYAVDLVSARALALEPSGRRWRAHCSDGSVHVARRLLLATGLAEELPPIPGLAALWGTLAVACPHCHGWEVRGEPVAQVGFRGSLDRSAQRAILVSRWSARTTLFTQGDAVDGARREQLHRAGVLVDDRPVERLERGEAGVDIVTADGARLPQRSVFIATRQRQQSALARSVGCSFSGDGPEYGAVMTDEAGRTDVAGVWAAGTMANPALLAVAAAGHAATVAVALHADLLAEDLASAPSASSPAQTSV